MTQSPSFQTSAQLHVRQDKAASVWVGLLKDWQLSEERDAKVVLTYGHSQPPVSPSSPSS